MFVPAPLPAGLTGEQVDDAKKALEVAQSYWNLADEIGASPESDWTARIRQIATGAAADGLEQSVTLLRRDGMKGIGATSVSVTVTRVEAGAVDLVACVDVSGHDFVSSDGQSYNAQKEPGALSRFRAESQVGEYETGWKVNMNISRPSVPC